MKSIIEKLAKDFNIEIIESDSKIRGVNSYKIDENGKVTNLCLEEVPINAISVLLSFAKTLKVLSLVECGLEDIKKIDAFSTLEELDLTLNEISDLKGLETLTNLKRLVLGAVYMDSISEIKCLTEIQFLDLSSNIEINFDNEFEALNNLVELDLEGNDLFNLSSICSIDSLKKMNLKNCKLDKIEGVEKFPNLEVLNLSGNPIEEIRGLGSLTKLKELRLNTTEISEIVGLDMLINLEALDLSDTNISQIKGLNNLTHLKDLNLSYTKIDKIEGLIELRKIELLMLISNKISVLENLPKDNLKTLRLDGNNINDLDYGWLKTLEHGCYINLSNNPVDIVKDEIPENVTIETKRTDSVFLIL